MSAALRPAVRSFADDVGAALAGVARGTGLDGPELRRDAALEACHLACALVATGGRRATDDEVWALTAAFGPELSTPLAGATPDQVRDAGLLDDEAGFLEQTSTLYRLLVEADARHGSAHSHVYYRAAVQVLFATAAADLFTSETELDAIERFRSLLLAEMTAQGVSRPGQGRPGRRRIPAGSMPVAGATAEGGPGPTDAGRSDAEGTDADDADDLGPPEPLEDLLEELDELVGLDSVKREVRRTADLTRIEQLRRHRGLPVLPRSRHLVFTGNPGTGKTTVARLLARLYRTLGVVARGHLVETDRSHLVAGFVGQTATLVRKRFDEADQGMLLIDEAYALVRGGDNDFGREAIDTIVKLVEDRRDSVVVVVAGYPDEMDEFIDANPGLRSRFPRTIDFPDYDTGELVRIFDFMGSKPRYACDAGAAAEVRDWFDAQDRVKGFGNGRLARNLFEAAVAHQASRLAGMAGELTDEQLTTLTAADIPGPADGLG
ncbi:MAG: AAA family ATPase [Acidimicrobiia bacterium]